jgi:hypothetical protein
MSTRPSPWLVWIPLALAVVVGALWFTVTRDSGMSVAMDAPASVPLGAPLEGVEPLPQGPREPIPLEAEAPIEMRVYMSPTCGCCSLWVEHLEANGFEVESVLRYDMGDVKASLGILPQLSSCHTGVVNGYLFEGHIPADDIRAFLAEAPDAMGLTVPGMPIGSPGMEMGDRIDPYDVLVFQRDGTTRVFSSYGK